MARGARESEVSVLKRSTERCRALLAVILMCAAGIGFSFAASATQSTDIEVIDDDGRVIRLSQPAQRIISLAPSMTELLFSLGAGDRVLGVMAYSDYPPEATQVPVVGQFDMLDMERIIALQPDLIVSWRTGNPRNSIRRLEALGLTVYVAEPDTLASIGSQLHRLGVLTGQQQIAEQLREDFAEQLHTITQENSSKPEVSVFYQVWDAPLISVGGPELINNMIETCGGRNIFAELPVGPTVNLEDVLARDPQTIIVSGSSEDASRWHEGWRRWSHLESVRGGHLYNIPPDLVQRHSLRALEGLQLMCTTLDRVRGD